MLNDIINCGFGIAKDDKPWIVFTFVWNPRILHFLPSLDVESNPRETAIALGWFFLNFVVQIIKTQSNDN